MADGWRRVAATLATDVCRRFDPGPAAAAALAPGVAPRAYTHLLAERGQFPDAVKFLAFALPKREALWWACGCVRRAAAGRSPAEGAALAAAERYVITPTDANRRAAMEAGEAAGFGTPGGSVAAAAFFSGGSLTPPDVAPVAPAEHLTPTFVTNAVVLSAVTPDPLKAPEWYAAFLKFGDAVADGADRWPDVK